MKNVGDFNTSQVASFFVDLVWLQNFAIMGLFPFFRCSLCTISISTLIFLATLMTSCALVYRHSGMP